MMSELSTQQIYLIAVVIVFLLIILIGILYYNVPWYKLKNMFIRAKNDELSFLRQFTYYGSYSYHDKFARESIDKILMKFRKMTTNNDSNVSIESIFNKNYYPTFDLDNTIHLDLFKKLYAATPYALFLSSKSDENDHYWAIVDYPYKKIEDIFYDATWKICNDPKYVSYCRNHNRLFIRGIYENKNRKPSLYETKGNLSKNFQLFIDKLSIYYNREGLEVSVLRYKDPEMLINYNRKRKLQQLNK